MIKTFYSIYPAYVVLIWLLILCSNSMFFAQVINQTQLEEAKKNVVRITTYKPDNVIETGSGIIAWSHKDGTCLIITALHVVEESEKLEVMFYDNRTTTLPAHRIERFDKDKDFTAIIVKNVQNAKELKPFNIVSDTTVKEMDKVFTIGHPGQSEWYPSSGEIRKSEDILYFAFSRESINPGNSGGGLFNDQFNLIGIVVSKRYGDGKALKINRALELLKSWGIPYNFNLIEKQEVMLGQQTTTSIWWYIGAGAVVGTIAAYFILKEDPIPDEEQLPGPPNPPSH